MSDMRDINTVASLITIAKAVKKAGYSPMYISDVLELPDGEEDFQEMLDILSELDMAKLVRTKVWSYADEYRNEWFWTDN